MIEMSTKKRLLSPASDLRDSELPAKPCRFELRADANFEMQFIFSNKLNKKRKFKKFGQIKLKTES